MMNNGGQVAGFGPKRRFEIRPVTATHKYIRISNSEILNTGVEVQYLM